MSQEPLGRDEFEQFREDDRAWKTRIEAKIDKQLDHTHRNYPTWAEFLTALIGLGLLSFLV